MTDKKRSRLKSSSNRLTPNLSRGRPKAEAVPQISAAIMAAATEIFLATGFEEASMEAIAIRAGVTKVTLYKRFPDKRSLLRAVLQEQRQQWTPPPPTYPDIEARLKYYAAAILARSISHEFRAFHALAVSAWVAPNDMPAREEVLGYNDMLQRLEQEIREGGQALGLRPVHASTVALALMAMLSGWFDHRVPNPGHEAVEAAEFANKAIELLMHGKAAW